MYTYCIESDQPIIRFLKVVSSSVVKNRIEQFTASSLRELVNAATQYLRTNEQARWMDI